MAPKKRSIIWLSHIHALRIGHLTEARAQKNGHLADARLPRLRAHLRCREVLAVAGRVLYPTGQGSRPTKKEKEEGHEAVKA